MTGQIYQINVKHKTPGQRGLPKLPTQSATVTFMGFEGDFNRYRHEILGDEPTSAVLIMPLETIYQLNEEGWPIQPGDMGENITTVGIPYASFTPGNIYRVGEAEIQIARICDPCTNLYLLPYVGHQMGPRFIRTMVGRRGWYCRVLREGAIKTGDPIEELVSSVTTLGYQGAINPTQIQLNLLGQ